MRGCFNQPGSDWLRGAEGVRSGYRIILFIALFMLLSFVTFTIIGYITAVVSVLTSHQHIANFAAGRAYAKAHPPHFPMWVFEAISIVVILITTKIMTWLEDRSLWSCYLNSQKRVEPLLGGILCGIVALSALIGILLITGHARISFQNAPIGTFVLNAIGGLILALMIGFNEEFTFRGYI